MLILGRLTELVAGDGYLRKDHENKKHGRSERAWHVLKDLERSSQEPSASSSTYYANLEAKFKTLWRQIYNLLFRATETSPSRNDRCIILNAQRETPFIDDRTERPYVDNTIRSSRYTVWNFLPLQLFAQFSKVANLYFPCISVVQLNLV